MGATVEKADKARFWRKFMRLTRGRVPVIRAMEVIIDEENSPDHLAILRDVHGALKGGSTLHDAVSTHPEFYSLPIRELVLSAEKTGEWDDILKEIADGLHEGTFD